MTKLVKKFISSTDGATAIEYSLLGGAIFLAIVSSVTLVGTNVQKPLDTAAQHMQ